MSEKNNEFNGLKYSELMHKPKPEICDYIMYLRGEVSTYSVKLSDAENALQQRGEKNQGKKSRHR